MPSDDGTCLCDGSKSKTEHVSARNGLPENTTPAWVRDALAEANAAHEQAIARQAMLKEQRDADERARNQNASLLGGTRTP